MFLEPIKKDNKLILIYKNPPVKNIVDVRIKSINIGACLYEVYDKKKKINLILNF